MNYVNLLLSFLGGGAFTAWFTWFLSQRSQRKADERTMLSEQLRLLYGPVGFCVSQNRVVFQLSRQIVKAAECDELNPVGADGKRSSAVSFDALNPDFAVE